MEDRKRIDLAGTTLAPYIQKATALIGHKRKVGGNQFRHAMATLAILIDYDEMNPVLLKAAVIHDLLEDVPDTNIDELRALDGDGHAVVELVLEVTRKKLESRDEYLQGILDGESHLAKVLKVADRISNLTDLNNDIFSLDYISKRLDETARYVLPIAQQVSAHMELEVADLIQRRRELLNIGDDVPRQ
jgi:(p)ppGpp synthase/HD superfamily hydrolase